MSQPICHSCGASNFRKSHFRGVDLPHLLFGLQYPVRCRVCQERRFLFVLTAFAFQHKKGKKGRPVQENGTP
jgi:hypothetical protein